MFEGPSYFVEAFLVVMIAAFGFRYFRYGSLTGALLGGRVERTVGEIALSAKVGSRVLKVDILRKHQQSEACVALSLVSKATFGASMVPIELTNAQAKTLAELLAKAVNRGP
jgi:hypothetical protein